MIIQLEGSKVLKPSKPDSGFVLSDNTMDFTLKDLSGKVIGRSDYSFELTGSGTRNLVIKNLWGTPQTPAVIDAKFLIKYSGTTNIIKFVNCRYWRFKGDYQIYGSGNNQSQPIMFDGSCRGWEFDGGYINQGRNQLKGGTNGGACVQAVSAESSTLNASNHDAEYAIFRNMVLENCCDEGYYLFKYSGKSTPKPSGSAYALIDNCRVVNVGRDPFQGRGIKQFEIINNYAENYGLELEPNHISGVSWNGENSGIIKGNHFKKGAQFIFAATEGKDSKLSIINNIYEQGDNGVISNQACYFRGDNAKFDIVMEGNTINAPKAKECAVTVDGVNLQFSKNNIVTAPKLSRSFNQGVLTLTTPLPIVTKTTGEITIVETVTYEGVKTIQYFLPSGQELKP
jgi:hypothetical protein